MRALFTIAATAVIFSLVMNGCRKNDEDSLENVDCAQLSAAYTADIKPIVSANCLGAGCHNSGSANGDFSTYTGLKAKADNGSLNNRVLVAKNMPPPGPLNLGDLKKIKCWLNSGAPNN